MPTTRPFLAPYSHLELAQIENEIDRARRSLRGYADAETLARLNAAVFILSEVRHAALFLTGIEPGHEEPALRRLGELFARPAIALGSRITTDCSLMAGTVAAIVGDDVAVTWDNGHTYTVPLARVRPIPSNSPAAASAATGA